MRAVLVVAATAVAATLLGNAHPAGARNRDWGPVPSSRLAPAAQAAVARRPRQPQCPWHGSLVNVSTKLACSASLSSLSQCLMLTPRRRNWAAAEAACQAAGGQGRAKGQAADRPRRHPEAQAAVVTKTLRLRGQKGKPHPPFIPGRLRQAGESFLVTVKVSNGPESVGVARPGGDIDRVVTLTAACHSSLVARPASASDSD